MAKGQKVVWYLCDKADSCAIQKFLCFYISVISNIYLKLGKKRFCFSSLKHGQNQSFVLLKTFSSPYTNQSINQPNDNLCLLDSVQSKLTLTPGQL